MKDKEYIIFCDESWIFGAAPNNLFVINVLRRI